MKRFSLILPVLLVGLLMDWMAVAQTGKPSPSSSPYRPTSQPAHQAFTYGEELVYKVRYNLYFNINVGEVVFRIDEQPIYRGGTKTMHVVARGRTYKFYDPMYKVRDRYETYMAVNRQLQPHSFVRLIREGKYRKDTYLTFNHQRQTVFREITNRGKSFTYSIPKDTYDMLSAIYAARNLDYKGAEAGDRYHLNTFIDDSTYHVGVRFWGREEIKTKAGRFRCMVLEPQLIAGDVFDQESKMKLWVTDDANRIPVRVESDIAVGAIRADLHTYEGLKHSMEARLE